MDKNFSGGGTFTTTLGNFTKIEVTAEGWYASGTGWSGSTWTGTPASSVSFSGEIMGYGGDGEGGCRELFAEGRHKREILRVSQSRLVWSLKFTVHILTIFLFSYVVCLYDDFPKPCRHPSGRFRVFPKPCRHPSGCFRVFPKPCRHPSGRFRVFPKPCRHPSGGFFTGGGCPRTLT